jgi:hypothetical protein
VYYVLSSELIGWRIPLHVTDQDNFTNDVRGTVFNRAPPASVVGVIPFNSEQAWIGLTGGGLDELARQAFDQ